MTARGEGFVPGRHAIDAVGPGGFRFANMSHRGSILILPSGIHAWPISSVGDLTPTSFQELFHEARDIDFVLIGTGEKFIALPSHYSGGFVNINFNSI